MSDTSSDEDSNMGGRHTTPKRAAVAKAEAAKAAAAKKKAPKAKRSVALPLNGKPPVPPKKKATKTKGITDNKKKKKTKQEKKEEKLELMKKNGGKRNPNFTTDEDLMLSKAFVNVSNDAVNGADQDGSTF